MKRIALTLSLLLFFVASAHAQYAYRIRPYPAAPATCQPGNGDVFYLTTGNIGMYQCTAANVWSNVGVTGTGGSVIISAAGRFGWTGRSLIASSADGLVTFTNALSTDFTRFNLGPIAVTHPSIAVSAAVGGQTQGIIILRADGTAQVQASLGAATNGSMIYCSDCTIANPCAGGGTGAIAKRLNGVWVCN